MYGRVFTSLWDGSMRGQSDLQLVFIYLLCQCDSEGVVDVIHSKIVDDTGMSLERVKAALLSLEAPDPDSRTQADDGRRLHRLKEDRAWGWLIVNHEHYSAIRSREDRKRQNREAQARFKDKARVSKGKQRSAESAYVDVDVDADVDEAKKLEHLSEPPSRSRAPETEPKGFAEFYQEYPRHDGRRKAASEFSRALKRRPDYTPDNLREGAELFAQLCAREIREPRFIPLPATWLSQDRFREFFDEDDHAETQEGQATTAS